VYRGEVTRRGHRRGLVVGWGLAAIAALAFLVGVFASIPDFPLVEVKGGWRYMIWTCLGVFLLLNIATAFRGTTLFGVRRTVSERVEEWLCKRGHQKLDELHARATKTTT
jgi:hypothetical protein